jgi:hypothetical protein
MGTVFKIALFSVVVLLLGNWIRFGGKTISDQVRTQMAHAERSPLVTTVKGWTERLRLPSETRQDRIEHKINPAVLNSAAMRDEEIGATERQKLKALIRELNSGRVTSAAR